MNNDIYRTFVSCFNEIGELQVSDREFAEKSEMLNRWMMTLMKKRVHKLQREVSPFIIKAKTAYSG